MRRFYVTTPIYYVNDLPHIGHIYTTVVCRHGRALPAAGAATTCASSPAPTSTARRSSRRRARRGSRRIALADRVVARYHELWQRLGISHDDFIRTTEPRHRRGRRGAHPPHRGRRRPLHRQARGLVLPGLRDLLHREGAAARAASAPTTARRWSGGPRRTSSSGCRRYQQPLLDWYDREPRRCGRRRAPTRCGRSWRGGLRDLSVSRSNLAVGHPVPRSPGARRLRVARRAHQLHQRAGLRRRGRRSAALYERYWAGDGGARMQLVGKDILRFHAVYWPAFLCPPACRCRPRCSPTAGGCATSARCRSRWATWRARTSSSSDSVPDALR